MSQTARIPPLPRAADRRHAPATHDPAIPQAARLYAGASRFQPKLEQVTWTLMIILSMIGLFLPTLRYFQYLIPFLALFHGLAERHVAFPRVTHAYLFLLLLGACWLPFASTEGAKDVFFILSGVSASLVIRRPILSPWGSFFLFIAGMVVGAYELGNLNGAFKFSILNSESTFEGNFGFLFGLLALFAAFRRNWLLLVCAIAASVLALKRIVLMGEMVCIPLALMPPAIVKRLINPLVMVAFNVSVVGCLILYATHAFDRDIGELTGQSANQFGQGRQEIQGYLAQKVQDNPARFMAVGEGPGSSYKLIESYGVFGRSNLHSDVLKVFYEYGAPALVVFIWLLYLRQSEYAKIFLLFTNILYFTDNVLIYNYYLFFLFAFVRVLESNDFNAAPTPLISTGTRTAT